MDNSLRIEEIKKRLNEHLSPSAMEIIDESHLHAGHVGAREGKGHFRLRISSDRFTEVRPIQCHRMIYDALGELMQTDIHALSIELI